MKKLSLKTQNIAPLSTMIMMQILCILLINFEGSELDQVITLLKRSDSLLLIGALGVFFSNLLPANIKNALPFFRFKNALPGHRFIQLSDTDPRIDSSILQSRLVDYCVLKNDPKRQNSYWYREIYRPLVENREVSSIHKTYLLYRDGAVVSLVCMLMFVTAKVILPIQLNDFAYSAVVIFMLFTLGLLLAANNAGCRFVTTAVAIKMTELNRN